MEQESALGVPADLNEMTFAVTPAGVRANIPIFTWRGEEFGDLYWSDARLGHRVFLHLELDLDSQASSAHRLSYQIGYPRLTGIAGSRDYFDVRPPDGPPSWKEVLIRHRPLLCRSPRGQLPDSMWRFIRAIPMQLTFDAPVRFPETCIKQFLMQSMGYSFDICGAGIYTQWRADSSVPTAYIFQVMFATIIIKVGQCQQTGSLGEQHRLQSIWATVSAEYLLSNDLDPIHDCSQDHVLQWPDLQKTFKLKSHCVMRRVTLSFTRCPLNPERTLILKASCRSRW